MAESSTTSLGSKISALLMILYLFIGAITFFTLLYIWIMQYFFQESMQSFIFDQNGWIIILFNVLVYLAIKWVFLSSFRESQFEKEEMQQSLSDLEGKTLKHLVFLQLIILFSSVIPFQSIELDFLYGILLLVIGFMFLYVIAKRHFKDSLIEDSIKGLPLVPKITDIGIKHNDSN